MTPAPEYPVPSNGSVICTWNDCLYHRVSIITGKDECLIDKMNGYKPCDFLCEIKMCYMGFPR